jgi:carbonic anhydrase
VSDTTYPVGDDDVWTDLLRAHDEYEAIYGHRRPVGEVPAHRPRAAILSCSDARVPPSVVFDQPAGALFVVRLAGNVPSEGAIASLAFAVEALGAPLVVVLGHTGCGAVTAAFHDHHPEGLDAVIDPITRALEDRPACATVDEAIVENVRHGLRTLADDVGPLGRAVRTGRVRLRGAVYDLVSGELRPVELDPAATLPMASDTVTPVTTTVSDTDPITDPITPPGGPTT